MDLGNKEKDINKNLIYSSLEYDAQKFVANISLKLEEKSE